MNRKLVLIFVTSGIICLLMFSLVVTSLVRFFQGGEKKNDVLPKHEIVSSSVSDFTELWRTSDIRLTWEAGATDLIAIEDKGFFGVITEGLYTPTAYSNIRSVDLKTGQVAWEVRDEINDNVAYNSNYIFAGVGYKKVVAYDAETGSVVWETPLRSKSISHMLATESELHIEANPAHFYVLDAETGAIKYSEPDSEGSPTFFIDDNIAYWQPLPLYLYATDTRTRNTIWEVQFADPYIATPLFTSEHIFVKTRLGRLYALDRSTGAVLWKIDNEPENYLASNISVSDDNIYFLTVDAQLWAVDIQTGETLGALKFEPSLLELSDRDYANNTFNVAASLDKILVYFGDSKQLFALQFSPDK